MHREREIFTVTHEAINATKRQAHAIGHAALSEQAAEHLRLFQPELYAYTADVGQRDDIDLSAYSGGVINTYWTIFNQLHSNGGMPPITDDDIELQTYNIADQNLFEISEGDSECFPQDFSEIYDDDGLTAFLDKLEKSSPDFFARIVTFLAGSKGYPALREQKSFLRGAYDVFMPVYRQHEARYLYDHLVLLPSFFASADEERPETDTLPDETVDS